MLPKKIYLNYVDENDECKTWSEYPVYVHCDIHNREYTDLSQVWHNSKEEPEKGRSIISIGSTGVSAYKWVDEWRCDWSDFAEWSELFRWAYVYDLLPKGGEL